MHNFENFWKSCHTTNSSATPSLPGDENTATSTISAFFQSDININKSNSNSDSDPYSDNYKDDGININLKKHENFEKNEQIIKNEKIWDKKEKRENPFREKKEIFKDPYEDGSDNFALNDKYSHTASIKKDETVNDDEQVRIEKTWSKLGSRSKESKTMEEERSMANDESENGEKGKEKGKEKGSLTKTADSADDLTRHNPYRKNGK